MIEKEKEVSITIQGKDYIERLIKKDIDEMIKAIREEDMYVTKFRVHCDKLYEKLEQLRVLNGQDPNRWTPCNADMELNQ